MKLLVALVAILLACDAARADDWLVESESPDYKFVHLGGDTVEVLAPKGLTLWRNEPLRDGVIIEYDACIVDEGKEGDRLSDLNCFWMASDPKTPDDIMGRAAWRQGIFVRCYSLQLYYMGFGGNYNSTTRFRRYNADERAIDNKEVRPAILKEYTDSAHLLKPNHWYHIRLTAINGRVTYTIDGETLVDYVDPNPLTQGYFGFRTTLARARIANFKTSYVEPVAANWIGGAPEIPRATTFGIPFSKGELMPNERLALFANSQKLNTDSYNLAYWPDGSVKWKAVSAVASGSNIEVRRDVAESPKTKLSFNDDLLSRIRLIASVNGNPCQCVVDSIVDEGEFHFRAQKKICGHFPISDDNSLPFILRIYQFENGEVKLVHTFFYDADENKHFVTSLGLQIAVPLSDELYNRTVAFAGDTIWCEQVQPLVGRRLLKGYETAQSDQVNGIRVQDKASFDARSQSLLDSWASWDVYRLSQLSHSACTIRKKAISDRPWIGTFESAKSFSTVFVGNTQEGVFLGMRDFRESFPSSFEVTGATSDTAYITAWMWPPEAEAIDLRHYDVRPHGLDAAYEDVQEGMSSPRGIARTSEFVLYPVDGFHGKEQTLAIACALQNEAQLVCTPAYLHLKKAFGVWSLHSDIIAQPFPNDSLDHTLDSVLNFYIQEVEKRNWYGFWNYGDVMHTFDAERDEWMYDVGGYAWDNTELASNSWLWYSFLRTGRADVWRLARAMTRHTSEVDAYHLGPWAGLGSRHNVSHWGCGAKEARISQAAFNRFLYYLTADDRIGDIMHEVRDAHLMLYNIDPMRLAEPRDKFPCSAPARLRIGPDWLAYVGNWMTEWERTGNTKYRDLITTGMQSIANLKYGFFTGNKALGFDPATGLISYDGDPNRRNAHHLVTIMGGFEIVVELMDMIDMPEWNRVWLDFCSNYRQTVRELGGSKFRISRLPAYAYSRTHDPAFAQEVYQNLKASPFLEHGRISTNTAATWSLDAIYALEVLR